MFGLLSGLGLRGSLFVAAVLIITTLYVYRALAIGRTLGHLMGSLAFYAIAILCATAVAIIAGWVDPNPMTFLSHTKAAISVAWDVATGPVRSALSWLVEVLLR